MDNQKKMNIWLDDQRVAPQGWMHLHNLDEVKKLIELVGKHKDFFIEVMSFDYHLGHPKKGVDVMKYLTNLCIQNNTSKFWPKTVLYHSNDPEGVKIMKEFAKSFNRDVLTK